MTNSKYLSVLLLCLFSVISYSQKLNQKYILQLLPNSNLYQIEFYSFGKKMDIEVKYISKEFGYATVEFPEGIAPQLAEACLMSNKKIIDFHPDRPAVDRGCAPNDPKYNLQYNIVKMNFDEVWCQNNSGLSPQGDTLVIGIIDMGFKFDLVDLIPNIFVNYGEVPDNNIDDDANGYVDDYYGWNARLGKGDQHPEDNHGTRVSSIIGARGGNSNGITGAAQKIKMIICSASLESEMIDCYFYFHTMKKNYIETKGKKGAYIVSTNTSLGFDKTFPNDLPGFCDLFVPQLSVGILNTCATANEDWNVDQLGDMPALCNSKSLIAVTNTDQRDQKVTDAGYGVINIDIAASGENIPCLGTNDVISTAYSGCSFSSPQVAAAAALMYQFCDDLCTLSKSHPDSALLLVRDLVLTSGPILTSLQNTTSTGRRLDVLAMFENLKKKCFIKTNVNNFEAIANPFNNGLICKIGLAELGAYELTIYDTQGRIILSKKEQAISNDFKCELVMPINAQGLYYVQLRTDKYKIAKSIVKI